MSPCWFRPGLAKSLHELALPYWKWSIETLTWVQIQDMPTSWRRVTLQWRHNELDGVSNHQSYDCLLNRLFGRKSKKTSNLRVTGLCVGNSPVTGEFPAQKASCAENVPIWWRHYDGNPLGGGAAGGFPHKEPVTRRFDVFFNISIIGHYRNSRVAGNLRRHDFHVTLL